MKKLKFFALALVAAFGFAACGEETEENYTQSQAIMGGAGSQLGSWFTFDNGVQTKEQLGETGANVIFAFSTLDETMSFKSGTEVVNQIVKESASETKFAIIGDAKASKFENLQDTEFNLTVVELNKKLENGKKAIAFKNDKCKGFFEIVDFTETEQEGAVVTLNVWIAK